MRRTVAIASDHAAVDLKARLGEWLRTAGHEVTDLGPDTPEPVVTNPTMSSPGTGVQQRASLTHTSSVPTTVTPGSPARERGAVRGARAVGVIIGGIFVFGDKVSGVQAAFMALTVVGVVGTKLFAQT